LTIGPGFCRSVSRFRVLLAGYWLLLAAGSHWPGLELFPESKSELIFQPDKGLHFVAFAGLTWLLIRAKIAGRSAGSARTLLAAGFTALSYAGLDELTQQWAQRQVAFSDFLASAIGVLTVVLAVAAQARPAPRRLRARRVSFLLSSAAVIALVIPPAVNDAVWWVFYYHTPWPAAHIDKPSHFLAALVLTGLLARSFPAGARRPGLGVWVTILVIGLSAPMIETVQGYTGRGMEIADVFAHQLGLATAMVVWAFVSMARALRVDRDNERA
jgi:VanZ family protein